MPERANHTIVVGEGTDAKTILAGQVLPTLPADELERLRAIGAIGKQAPPDEAIVADDDRSRTLNDEASSRVIGAGALPAKTAANAPPAKQAANR